MKLPDPILFRDFPEEWKSLEKQAGDYPSDLNTEYGSLFLGLSGLNALGLKDPKDLEEVSTLTQRFYSQIFSRDYDSLEAQYSSQISPLNAIKLKLTQHFEALLRLVNPKFELCSIISEGGFVYLSIKLGKETSVLDALLPCCLVLPKGKARAQKKIFRLKQLAAWNP